MDNFVIRKNQKPLANQPVINVYTDGACQNNGKPDARAGFGIWFGEDDERNTVKEGLAHESLFGVDPRQAQAMAGGDMGQMDFGPEGQPMMGQEGLRQRLFDIAQQKARQKYRPETQAGEQSSEIQAMQAELDRRG